MRAAHTVRLVATLCLVGAAPSLSAQATRPLATVNGFAPDRLARIDSALQRYVDDSKIAGAVALVMRDGKVVYEKAIGWSDREANKRMTTDAIFRIASQSKAITSVAALMLVEEGKINLSDPVSRWIPTFAKTTVAVRRDSTKPASDSNRVIVPARRPDHGSRSAHAHVGHFVRRRARSSSACTMRKSSATAATRTAGTPPTRTSRSAPRWSDSARCRSSRSRARRGCTATTSTFSGA